MKVGVAVAMTMRGAAMAATMRTGKRPRAVSGGRGCP